MKKKGLITLFAPKDRIKKSLIFMNYVCFFMLFCGLHVSANVFSQHEKVVFKSDMVSVEEIFDAITTQLKYDVFYSEDKLNTKNKLELSGREFTVDELLQKVLGKTFQYRLEGKTILITPSQAQQQKKYHRYRPPEQ